MSNQPPNPATPLPEIDYSVPGMRIQSFAPEAPWPLTIRTAAPLPDWTPEPQGEVDRVSIMVTPTTILYRGRRYRIHESEPAESGWIYRLHFCPEGETLHQVIELEREAVRCAAAEKKEFDQIQRRARVSASYEILLGWLPARQQEALSRRWQFSPANATRKNGMLTFLLGLGAAIPSMFMIHRGAGFVMMILAAEGAARWAYGFAGETPCGFIPLEAAAWLLRRARAPFRRLP